MPIIEPSPDSPSLRQGDILQGVRLFVTKDAGEPHGGNAVKSPHSLSLVLSRPCVVQHRQHVVLAAVEKYPDSVPRETQSFERVREFLTDMRDGVGRPDVFYLGQIPGRQGRFCARLDAIYTVEVPTTEPALSAFLKYRRVGTLNSDFLRDLHLRVFRAFASLGFTDEGWLSDEDLTWLVAIGEADLKEAEVALSKAEATKLGRVADGKQYEQGTIEGLREKVNSLKQKLAPYREEKSRRQ